MEIIMQFNIAGSMKNQIDIPEDRITLNSLFLLSFINVCIELRRNMVGNTIGNNEGM